MLGTPAPEITPANSARRRTITMFGLVVAALISAGLAALAYASFTAADESAVAYVTAPSCEAGPSCVETAAVTVTSLYQTHSRSGTTYWATLRLPGAGMQTTTLASLQYQSIEEGETLSARIWRGEVIYFTVPGRGGVTTDAYPPRQLAEHTFFLLMWPLTVGLVAAAAGLALSAVTPEDIMRATVTASSPAPRAQPAGLAAAVLGWRKTILVVSGMAMSLVAEIGYGGSAAGASHVASVSSAPLGLGIAFVVGDAIAFLVLWRRAVRDATEGVYADVVVLSERTIRGRYGPIGVRAKYALADGRLTSIRISRRWWRSVTPGSRLAAVVHPRTGRIRRLLGLHDSPEVVT